MAFLATLTGWIGLPYVDSVLNQITGSALTGLGKANQVNELGAKVVAALPSFSRFQGQIEPGAYWSVLENDNQRMVTLIGALTATDTIAPLGQLHRTAIKLERIPEKCVRFSDKDTRKNKGLSVLNDFVFVQNAQACPHGQFGKHRKTTRKLHQIHVGENGS